MNVTDTKRKTVILRTVFLTGALIDALIALEWYMISLGLLDIPMHPSFFQGSGQDYRFVLSIAALFMAGWAFLLFWGSLQPVTRSGVLLLTAIMLFVAVLSDGLVFGHLLSARQIALGTLAKLVLVALFVAAYWYSKQAHLR